jgi:hypothetical protein
MGDMASTAANSFHLRLLFAEAMEDRKAMVDRMADKMAGRATLSPALSSGGEGDRLGRPRRGLTLMVVPSGAVPASQALILLGITGGGGVPKAVPQPSRGV